MAKCPRCERPLSKEHKLKEWQTGKGKRKTIIEQWRCPYCYKSFRKSRGSVLVEDKESTED